MSAAREAARAAMRLGSRLVRSSYSIKNVLVQAGQIESSSSSVAGRYSIGAAAHDRDVAEVADAEQIETRHLVIPDGRAKRIGEPEREFARKENRSLKSKAKVLELRSDDYPETY